MTAADMNDAKSSSLQEPRALDAKLDLPPGSCACSIMLVPTLFVWPAPAVSAARRRSFFPSLDAAAEAFARPAERGAFTTADDDVFCNRLGRPLDGSALRRRFKAEAETAGLCVLRFRALHH
jgi:hypothetical protein